MAKKNDKMKRYIKEILDSGLGIIGFGETSHGTHNQVFNLLSKQMNLFNGIFLEEPVNYQSSIDFYLKFGKFDEDLKRLIEGAVKEGKDIRLSLSILLNSARKANIPVYCIDSSKTKTEEYKTKSKFGHYFLKGDSRDEDMFTNVVNIINKSQDKWCLIGGSQHIKYGIDFRSKGMTLGERLKRVNPSKFFNICLWQIPKTQTVRFFNVRYGSNPELEKLMKTYNYSNLDETGNFYFDGYIVHF